MKVLIQEIPSHEGKRNNTVRLTKFSLGKDSILLQKCSPACARI